MACCAGQGLTTCATNRPTRAPRRDLVVQGAVVVPALPGPRAPRQRGVILDPYRRRGPGQQPVWSSMRRRLAISSAIRGVVGGPVTRGLASPAVTGRPTHRDRRADPEVAGAELQNRVLPQALPCGCGSVCPRLVLPWPAARPWTIEKPSRASGDSPMAPRRATGQV